MGQSPKQTVLEKTMKNAMIDPADVAMLFIDHQNGLFNLVKDMPVSDLKRNVIALAKAAAIFKLPVITTASVPDGPNGPLLKEIKLEAPQAIYVPRHGEINAWDIDTFREAVKKTGKKTLIIAGTLTSVCLAFPSLSAVQDGYRVYAVIDASGNHSAMATDITMARLVHHGVEVVDTLAIISELQKTWNRAEAQQFADIFADVMPNYRLLMEIHQSQKA